MERNINLDEITDGKRYGIHDLVKVGCDDCKDCFACCKGMGTSIRLDPLDIYHLTTNLNITFEHLLQHTIELNVVDGLILPNLKMVQQDERCAYLNESGRCSIHAFRPGICRIFPLGRLYENGSFDYILQKNECKKEQRTKVKVQKWIATPNIKENEAFIIQWHYFIKEVQTILTTLTDDASCKQINLYVLQLFFIQPYDATKDFYSQFSRRYEQATNWIRSLCTTQGQANETTM